MLDGATPTLPERHLAQFLGDALRLNRRVADAPGTNQLQAALHQRLAGVDAADAADILVSTHLDQRVQVLLWVHIVVPAALRRAPHQRDRADLADLHRRSLPQSGRAYHAAPTPKLPAPS